MRHIGHRLRIVLCLFMAVFCTGMGCEAWQATAAERGRVRIVCEDGLTVEHAEQIRAAESEKEDGVSFTAWREHRGCAVRNEAGGRVTYTDVLELCGSSELVIPAGKVLLREDASGCLIGERLAEELFGTHSAKGLTLEYGGRELTVRGVLKEPGMLLAVQTVEEDTVFDRITLLPQSGRTRGRTAQRFAATYGLDADWLCYELLSSEYLRERIPGKWSDFAGWRQSAAQMKEDIRRALSVEKSSIELIYLQKQGKAVLFCGTAMLLAVLGLRTKKNSGTV